MVEKIIKDLKYESNLIIIEPYIEPLATSIYMSPLVLIHTPTYFVSTDQSTDKWMDIQDKIHDTF